MTKQNKKTIKTQAKKQNKKALQTIAKKEQPKKEQAKAEQKPLDFKTALQKNDIAKALILTREQRKAYAKQFFTQENTQALFAIASRFGYVGTFGRQGIPYTAELLASNNPIKTDLQKINTIDTPFNNKPRYNLTARQVFAILTAYFLRDNDKSFARILPTGLFLENGVLRDLITSGYLTNEGGEGMQQRFGFTDKLNFIFTDKNTKALENKLATADLI